MSEEILQYPYPLDLRWNHVLWLPIMIRRYRHSRMQLLADWDVKGAAFDLMVMSMDFLPPGTLPLEGEMLAWRLRMPPEQWDELMSREITPLYGWVKVQVGDEVRQTHPVLLEALEVAVKAAKLRQRGTTKRRRGMPPDAGRAPK